MGLATDRPGGHRLYSDQDSGNQKVSQTDEAGQGKGRPGRVAAA